MRILLLIFLLASSLSCFGSGYSGGFSEGPYLQEQEVSQDTTLGDLPQIPLQKGLKYDTEPAPSVLEFQEERLQDFKADPEFDYSETTVQDTWWSRFKRYLNLKYQQLLHWLFGDYEASSIIIFIIKLLPYLVILMVILLAVWIFNRMNPGAIFLSESEGGKVFLSEEEEIVKTSDISDLIQKAVAEENYRLAIRYYFLLILQQLTRKELINYEFSKTDEDYLREIQQQPLQQQFRQLTRIYDFIWYGNFEASQEQFLKSKREFEKMQDLIQKAHE